MAPTCTQMDVEPIPPSQPQSFRNTINGISGINGLAIELSEAEQMALSRHGMPRVTDNMIECCDRNWVSVSGIATTSNKRGATLIFC